MLKKFNLFIAASAFMTVPLFAQEVFISAHPGEPVGVKIEIGTEYSAEAPDAVEVEKGIFTILKGTLKVKGKGSKRRFYVKPEKGKKTEFKADSIDIDSIAKLKNQTVTVSCMTVGKELIAVKVE